MNFPLLLDTGRNLSLLFGATDKLEGRLNRLTVVIDKTGKIVHIDKEVNPSSHGPDLVDFFKSIKSSNSD